MGFKYTESTKVADMLTSNPNQMLLLEHLGISPLVQGKSVEELCAENNLRTTLYLAFATLYEGEQLTSMQEFEKSDLHNILTYLKNCHRYYLDEKIPKIKIYVDEITAKGKTQGLKLLHDFTSDYIAEVTAHFNYENSIVFPYVAELEEKGSSDSTYCVTQYKQHHDNIEDKLTDLRELLVKYLPFDDSNHLRRKLLKGLYELEYDLKIHSHIEDAILIPLVEKYESNSKSQDTNANRENEELLSVREKDVLRCLIQGKSNKEVADQLCISTHTVISHRKNISEKTGIKSLAGLTIYAIVHGIVNIESIEADKLQ